MIKLVSKTCRSSADVSAICTSVSQNAHRSVQQARLAHIDTAGKRPRIIRAQPGHPRCSVNEPLDQPSQSPLAERSLNDRSAQPAQPLRPPPNVPDFEDSDNPVSANGGNDILSSDEDDDMDDPERPQPAGWIDSEKDEGMDDESDTDDENDGIDWDDEDGAGFLDEDLDGLEEGIEGTERYESYGKFARSVAESRNLRTDDLFRVYKDPPPRSEKELMHLCAEGILTGEMSQRTYNKLESVPGTRIPSGTFQSIYKVRKGLFDVSGHDATLFDCCINGCQAFTGRQAPQDTCTSCNEARWTEINGKKRPRQQFAYISHIRRLQAMYLNGDISEHLRYRSRRNHDPDMIEDIFDGDVFRQLLETEVTWAGRPMGRRYFDQGTDLALGLGTDSIPLFKRRNLSCWPLVLTNYSLPPELRNRKEYQICCGLIPGAKEDGGNGSLDIDSFLFPLVQDLQRLACEGVPAIRNASDGRTQRFTLRAHLVVVIGDMPAMAKVMHFKGHNAKVPCRCCLLPSIPRVNARSNRTTYYSTIAQNREQPMDRYLNLPLRDDATTRRTIKDVMRTSNEELKGQTGVNGESILTVIGSLRFPWSFPLDIMHVLYENIMKELLSLWEGKYKLKSLTGSDDVPMTDDFVLPTYMWKAMDNEIVASNKTVPAEMASRVRSIGNRGQWTAESYSYFLLFLGPIVLKDRLPLQYYKHFLLLSDLVRKITRLEIERELLPDLKKGFARWVRDFEKLYYRFDTNRLPLMTLPIHSLLHISDLIAAQGPPCYYWCFALERFGGWLKENLHNRKDPVVALSNVTLREEQIHLVLSLMSSEARSKVLTWAYEDRRQAPWASENFQDGRLCERIGASSVLEPRILSAIRTHLQTRAYSDVNMRPYVDPREFNKVVFERFAAYRSSTYGGLHVWRLPGSGRSSRDASWVMFYQVEDRNNRTNRRRADFVRTKAPQYGQVVELVRFEWEGEYLQLAVIQPWQVRRFLPPGIGEKQYAYPPVELTMRATSLQVVGVEVLGTVCGRVQVNGTTGRGVIFDTSLGSAVPNFRDGE